MTCFKTAASSIAAACLAVTLPACTRIEPAPDAGVAQPAETAAADAAGGVAASLDDKARAQGDCDLLTKAELDAAFGGKLAFGKLDGHNQRGSGCTIATVGVEGQFILQAESREAFEARRDAYENYVRQSSATMEPVNVGVEGYIVNDAQIIAIDDQGRAISAALQLFVFGGDLPITPQESARGVEAIARQALERL